jgi:hypothetical protein
MIGSSVVLTPAAWTIVTGLVLPVVVGTITKFAADPKVKVVVGIVVAALAALVQRAAVVDGGAVISTGLLADIAATYGVQLLAYLGLYKAVDANAWLAPKFGVGGSSNKTGS